ncbi:unnamed protein product [Protopolystoma xenopodis]|uniref:Uncharacterized protein n=1 Tax=Protopolystoma xenopodis TaxID=117903 RepID=A0A448WP37_9PLAT|nr:unnamed protein product [Protopolystoma xenopodis]
MASFRLPRVSRLNSLLGSSKIRGLQGIRAANRHGKETRNNGAASDSLPAATKCFGNESSAGLSGSTSDRNEKDAVPFLCQSTRIHHADFAPFCVYAPSLHQLNLANNQLSCVPAWLFGGGIAISTQSWKHRRSLMHSNNFGKKNRSLLYTR